MAGNSRTSKYYRKNPKAAAKRKAYDRKYSKKNYGSQAPDSAAKRKRNKTAAERAKWRKKNGMVNTAKGRGKDASHTKSGRMVSESSRRNRSRNGKSGRSTKK